MRATKEYERLQGVLGRFVLLLSSLLAGLLIGEGITRLVTPQTLVAPVQEEMDGLLVPRANSGGRYAVPNEYDVNFHINSQHFRGRTDFQLEPDPGVVRIAALGDSVTFGTGANDNQTYPPQLEGILRNSLALKPPKLGVEVINAGIPGASLGRELLYYETWVKRFHPQIVILGVFFDDAQRDNGLFFYAENGKAQIRSSRDQMIGNQTLRRVRLLVERLPAYAFLSQHSQLVALVRNAISRTIQNRRNATSSEILSAARIENDGEQFKTIILPLMVAEIKWIHERVRESGGQLVIAFLPSVEIIYPFKGGRDAEAVLWKTEAMIKTLKELTSQENIPFTDITPKIREQAERQSLPLYYIRSDYHPTPAGYRAIAEAIAGFLVADGVFRP